MSLHVNSTIAMLAVAYLLCIIVCINITETLDKHMLSDLLKHTALVITEIIFVYQQ